MKRRSIMKDEEKLSFRLLTAGDLDEVVALCDECVGENLYPRDELARAVGSEDRFFYLLHTESGETVGYIYFYLTDTESIARYAKLGVEQFRAVCPNAEKPVGKIQSIGVKRGYRGKGLAARMLLFALGKLEAALIEAVFIVCWKVGEVVPLRKALQASCFSYLAEAHKVWYDDTALICPSCGGRCRCDAEVYYKILEQGGSR